MKWKIIIACISLFCICVAQSQEGLRVTSPEAIFNFSELYRKMNRTYTGFYGYLEETKISKAVDEFNVRQSKDKVGVLQKPLTRSEVKAAMMQEAYTTYQGVGKKADLLKNILSTNKFPPGSHLRFESGSMVGSVSGEHEITFWKVWLILGIKIPEDPLFKRQQSPKENENIWHLPIRLNYLELTPVKKAK